MDANGLRFWMIADDAQWARAGDPPGSDPPLAFDAARRRLRLASRRADLTFVESRPDATSRLETIPASADGSGTRASWDGAAGAVVAGGVVPGATPLPIDLPGAGPPPTDVALGFDGVLYVAVGGKVVAHDLRGRWRDVTVEAEGFQAWRLAAAPSGGAWALDRVSQRLGRIRGAPRPSRPASGPPPEGFHFCAAEADSLRLEPGVSTPPGEVPVAIACGTDGRLALLTWTGPATAARLYLDPEGGTAAPLVLNGVTSPYSLAWLAAGRVAVLATGLNEALAYDVDVKPGAGETAAALSPVGDLYPLRNHSGGPFLHGPVSPPLYPVAPAPGGPASPTPAAPLVRVSLPSFAREGEARNRQAIDSGDARTVWHRLYLEAVIPPHCGVVVALAATDDPTTEPASWFEHRFGAAFGPGDPTPRGAWVPFPSEVPFHPGVLGCPPEKNRAGLFTALVQRHGRRVSALRGRYLRVRVRLIGDGRSSPEVAALRAYAPRFSYVDNYLPELYRETEFGTDADGPGDPTPADFLERFLGNLEGILTPIEDRIGASYLLTDPRTTTDDAVEWLGRWVGLSFDPAYPPARRRALLENAIPLYRRRGTVDGLRLALDVATGGAVARGAVVIVEDFRLRRTFATILGADLADEFDPLVAGTVASGNSYVGDSLIVGDERRKDFLALFNPSVAAGDAAGEAAVEALFDGLAHRVTVLVHDEVDPQDLGLIRRVVELETPAHVLARVVEARYPLLVGVAALVGIDTYLGPAAPPRPAEFDRSRIGEGDRLTQYPGLDPRLSGLTEAAAPPVAVVPSRGPVAVLRAEPPVAEFGRSFVLDAKGSRPSEGASLKTYQWTRLD